MCRNDDPEKSGEEEAGSCEEEPDLLSTLAASLRFWNSDTY
jgi:hypothetical protein